MSDQQHKPEGGRQQGAATVPVPGQSSSPPPHASQRPEVSFTPVSNGMDYLVSVFEHLTKSSPPTARDLKYAVLHLQAATEVILKAALAQEHFSLVFSDPAQASHELLETGKLSSCSTLQAFDRLKRIARLALSDKDRERIERLADIRNKLQHFGLQHSAHSVESRAAHVLEFLITFVHRHLIPGLAPSEKLSVERSMDSFRLQLKGITKLVRQRMNNLRQDLDPLADVTVQCPDCEQWALVADGRDEGPTCLFCLQTWDDSPASAAANYAWIVLGLDEQSGTMEEFDPPVWGCPGCSELSLVTESVTVSSKPASSPLCFSCGTVFSEYLTDCGGCGTLMDPGMPDKLPLCNNCSRFHYPGELLK
ncbi:hypothetical protein ABZ905_31920 [Streptomyces parvus]|uniref:hypothetical protein n=1 Tax=Streptomyces parvus TaxID=66428 RepID=UPI003404E935